MKNLTFITYTQENQKSYTASCLQASWHTKLQSMFYIVEPVYDKIGLMT